MVNCDLVQRISKMPIIDDDADNSNRIVMINIILSRDAGQRLLARGCHETKNDNWKYGGNQLCKTMY